MAVQGRADRPHSALVGQGVGAGDASPLQACHDHGHALLHLLLVGVPILLHVGHWYPVCAEEYLQAAAPVALQAMATLVYAGTVCLLKLELQLGWQRAGQTAWTASPIHTRLQATPWGCANPSRTAEAVIQLRCSGRSRHACVLAGSWKWRSSSAMRSVMASK